MAMGTEQAKKQKRAELARRKENQLDSIRFVSIRLEHPLLTSPPSLSALSWVSRERCEPQAISRSGEGVRSVL